jgi:hypothetical protein
LACQTTFIPSSEQEFVSSANDAITETSHKPDIILTGKGKKGSTFAQVCTVIEVKYTSGTTHCKDAIYAFADKSWFMLNACDQECTLLVAHCATSYLPHAYWIMGAFCIVKMWILRYCPYHSCSALLQWQLDVGELQAMTRNGELLTIT